MVIGISGKKGSGKDTALINALPLLEDYYVVRVAFADPLKEEVFTHILRPLGLSKEIIDDPEYKEGVRPVVIWWGNFIRRRLTSKEYWVDALDKIIIEIERNHPDAIIIVTDVRFKNEAKFLQTKWNAYIVRVKRKKPLLKAISVWFKSLFIKDDISETELDLFDFDYVIQNNSTPEVLGQKLAEYIRLLAVGVKN